MEQRECLYESETTQVYRTADGNFLSRHAKKEAPAVNQQTFGTIGSPGIDYCVAA